MKPENTSRHTPHPTTNTFHSQPNGDRVSITLIAAMAKNRVIGKDGKMPWYCKEDFEWFRENTRGKVVVMGRKTHESIGRALPDRHNLVLTRQRDYQPFSGATRLSTLDDVFRHVGLTNDGQYRGGEIMVIGGGEIYNLFLPLANKVLLTHFDHSFEGDALFPLLGAAEWEETKLREGYSCTPELPFSFWEYRRRML